MALKTFNPLHVAIVDVSKNKEFIHQTYFEKDSAASISLIKNELDLLEYKFNATKQQATIFSEVFYADKKGKGWQAYLDGRPVDHFRVNYILRAMIIPAGKHIIEFKFEPKSFLLGQKISFIGSLLLSLLILFGIYHWWRSNRNIISVPKK
jgi:uncharacterized membrane protein YfhO